MPENTGPTRTHMTEASTGDEVVDFYGATSRPAHLDMANNVTDNAGASSHGSDEFAEHLGHHPNCRGTAPPHERQTRRAGVDDNDQPAGAGFGRHEAAISGEPEFSERDQVNLERLTLVANLTARATLLQEEKVAGGDQLGTLPKQLDHQTLQVTSMLGKTLPLPERLRVLLANVNRPVKDIAKVLERALHRARE